MLYPKEYIDLVNSLLPEFYEKDSLVFSENGFKVFNMINDMCITYENYHCVIEKCETLKIAKNKFSEICFNNHISFNSNNGLIKYYKGGHVSEFPTNFFDWTEEDFFYYKLKYMN